MTSWLLLPLMALSSGALAAQERHLVRVTASCKECEIVLSEPIVLEGIDMDTGRLSAAGRFRGTAARAAAAPPPGDGGERGGL